MTIFDVKKEFQLQLSHLYSKHEIANFVEMLFEDNGISKYEMVRLSNSAISEDVKAAMLLALSRLEKSEPIQYIREKADFYGEVFYVNQGVLIPRQETELLVHTIIANHTNQNLIIIDACTGSGCIAISLQKHFKNSAITAVDISDSALVVAKKNNTDLQASVQFIQADILDVEIATLLPKCDVLVSNPPYVCDSEKQHMHANVLEFEPSLALFVEDANPLLFYEALARLGTMVLQENGYIYCEINEAFGKETQELFVSYGYSSVQIIQDLHNKPRFIQAQKQ